MTMKFNDKHQESLKQKSIQISIQNLRSDQCEILNFRIKNKLQTLKYNQQRFIFNIKQFDKVTNNNDSGIKKYTNIEDDLVSVLRKAQSLIQKTINLEKLFTTLKISKQFNDLECFNIKRPPLLKEMRRQYSEFKSATEKIKVVKILIKDSNLNEVTKQYIQCKSQQKQAGNLQVSRFLNLSEVHKIKNNISKGKMSDYSKGQSKTFNENLQNLFLKTQNILQKYKSKELQWKKQKKQYRDEIRVLKQLLIQNKFYYQNSYTFNRTQDNNNKQCITITSRNKVSNQTYDSINDKLF